MFTDTDYVSVAAHQWRAEGWPCSTCRVTVSKTISTRLDRAKLDRTILFANTRRPKYRAVARIQLHAASELYLESCYLQSRYSSL